MPDLFGSGPVGQIVGGAAGLVSGLLPGGATDTSGKSTTNSNQTTNSNSSSQNSSIQDLINLITSLSSTTGSGTSTSTTTPNLDPQTQALINKLTAKYSNLTNPSLQGYAVNQTAQINNNANLQQQAAQQNMAARGLGGSPAAATTVNNIDAQRYGAVTNMQNQLPILQNTMNVSNLASAAQFMNMIPHGTTTTGATTNQSDTAQIQEQNQNQTGQNFANQWGYSNTDGTSNTATTSTSQKRGSIAGGLAGLIAGAFSDVRLKKDIKPIDKAIDKIMSLRPVTWKWKGGEVEDAGLLAQDIAKRLPELIDKTDKSGYLKVNYAGLIGTLVGAVQELAEAK